MRTALKKIGSTSCLTRATSLMLGVFALVVLSRPMPMDSTVHLPITSNQNAWWTSALDHALESSSFRRVDTDLVPSVEHTDSLQHTSDSAHASADFLPDSQLPRNAASHASTQHAAIGLSPQSNELFNDQQLLPQISGWTHEPVFNFWPSLNHPVHEHETMHLNSNGHLHMSSYVLPEARESQPEHASSQSLVMSDAYLATLPEPAAKDHRLAPWGSYLDELSHLTDRSSAYQGVAARGHHDPSTSDFSPGQSSRHSMSALDSSREPSKPKNGRGTIPGSKFLEHHPQFSVQYNVPPTLPEMSPEADRLKMDINRNLFSNALKWTSNGDETINSIYRDDQFHQFVRRIKHRKFWFVAEPREPWLHGRLVVAPHKSFSRGSVMFNPEPGVKSLLFSFWIPSTDGGYRRLQYVGSASLAVDDATEILNRPKVSQDASSQPLTTLVPPLPRVVAPLRQNIPASSFGRYTSARAWLKSYPMVEQVLPADSEARIQISQNLISETHRYAEQIKDVANNIFFNGHAVWQNTPEETMLNAKTDVAAGIFRYHKRSRLLFLARSETLRLLPYRVILIPYQIQGPRAKLFSSSLRGRSHVFTLWAASDVPGGKHARQYLFISGGAVSTKDTEDVLRHGVNTMKQLTEAGLHSM